MNDSIRLGDAELDAEHAALDSLIRQLLDAPPAGRLQALDALKAHAAQHFSAEDQSLRDMADGNSQCHLDEHAAVLASLGEVRGVLSDAAVTDAAKTVLIGRLATQLLAWLPEHVQAMDAGVATHRTTARFGGAPVVLRRKV